MIVLADLIFTMEAGLVWFFLAAVVCRGFVCVAMPGAARRNSG